MATIKYKVFPYTLLKDVKDIINPPPPPLKHSVLFYHKKSFYKLHSRPSYDVVFIGDSITDGAEWQDMFPHIKVANRGIGSDRTDGILERLNSVYSTSAKQAFIMVGINDFVIGTSVDKVFRNYKSIVNQIQNNGMTVYIQSTILAGTQRKHLNKKINKLNKQLKQLAQQQPSVHFIDLNVRLSKHGLLNPKYSKDGVHLNGEGYAVWKSLINPYMPTNNTNNTCKLHSPST